MRIFATINSYIFHPLFFPLYAFVFLMWCNPYFFADISSPKGIQILVNVVINTIILPTLMLFGVKQLGLLKDIQLSERKQRAIPYLIMIFFFFWTFTVFLKQDFPPGFVSIMLGATVGLFLAYLINVLFFKISLHAIGAGAFIATVIYASTISIYPLAQILLISILIAGIIGSSRLILKAHNSNEIYFGYLLGFIVQSLAYILM